MEWLKCFHEDTGGCNSMQVYLFVFLTIYRYGQYLGEASNFGVKKGLAMGCGMAFLQLVVFASYTLAFW